MGIRGFDDDSIRVSGLVSAGKQIRPRRAKGRDPLVGPGLILRRRAGLALCIVPDPARVAAVRVDLFEGGLQVERQIGVVAGQGTDLVQRFAQAADDGAARPPVRSCSAQEAPGFHGDA